MEYVSLFLGIVALYFIYKLYKLYKDNIDESNHLDERIKNSFSNINKQIDEIGESVVASGLKNRTKTSELEQSMRTRSEDIVTTERLIVNNMRRFINSLGYVIDDNTVDWKFYKKAKWEAMKKQEALEAKKNEAKQRRLAKKQQALLKKAEREMTKKTKSKTK